VAHLVALRLRCFLDTLKPTEAVGRRYLPLPISQIFGKILKLKNEGNVPNTIKNKITVKPH
jgi:hypothetical protein